MSELSASTAPAPVEKASLWEDFIDILFSPVAVFRRRAQGNWLIPLLVVSIAVGVIAFASRGVLQPVMDAEFEKAADALRKNPQVTEDMIERVRSWSEFTATFGAIIITPIVIVIVGFMTWIVGKLVDAQQELRSAFVVASYAMVPRVVQGIANAVQGLLLKPEQLNSLAKLTFSPARFADAATTSPVMLQILMRFDLFTIWVTVLLAIGLYATGRVSKQRAVIGGILFWLVGSIPAILGGLRQTS